MNTPTNIQITSPSRRHTKSPLARLLLRGGLRGLLLSLLAVTVGVLMASGMVLAQQQQSTTTEPSYTVEDLGSLVGPEGYSVARGINAAGQVVGYSRAANGYYHAFLYENGQMTDLGMLGG